MDIILVPGFWLGADSWSDVLPVLEAAGHTPHPLTLPGLESVEADRSAITLRDHVDAVVAAIDNVGGPVVLVGHSGGGPIAYGAADQRVDQVRAMVYVDTWPLADGMSVNTEYPAVDGSVAFPDWSQHDPEDVDGLDEASRARLLAVAVPEPVRVASDGQELHDERRRDIPATIISSSRPRSAYDDWMDHPFFAELKSLKSVSWVELPEASHWPQFTRPRELGEAIVAALD